MLSLLLLLAFTACAGKQPDPTPPPKEPQIEELPPSVELSALPPPAPPELPPPPAIASMEEPEEKAAFLGSSDLKSAISKWIKKRPRADYDEVARAANRLMRKLGYPFVLDVSQLLSKEDTEFHLKVGRKTFVFSSEKALSRTFDVCGERYLRVPARIFDETTALLVDGQKTYPFSLEPFGRETFLIYKKDELVSILSAPEPSEPIGVSANGKALFLKFPLHEEQTTIWWQRMGRQQPAILDEEPYLTLRVEKNRIYFDENIERLPPQDIEVEENTAGTIRWKFFPSRLIVELPSKCVPNPN